MGIPVYAEVTALPCYFIDTAIPEPAGDGMIRVTNYHTRNGVLIPQFEAMIHSNKLILANRALAEVAGQVFKMEMLALDLARH